MNPLRIVTAIGNWFTAFIDFLKEKNSFAIAFLIAIGAIMAEGYIIYVQDARIQGQSKAISEFGMVLLKRDSINRASKDEMRDRFQSRLDAANDERMREQSEMLRKFNLLDSAKKSSTKQVASVSTSARRAKANVADLQRKSDSLEKLLKKRLK